MDRIAGIINFKVDGDLYRAKGAFTYGLGTPKREAVIGSDGVHGWKETAQVAFIDGVITDNYDLDLRKLALFSNVTSTLELSNGKVISLPKSWYAGEGTGSTEEGEIPMRVEAVRGDEIR